MERVQKGKLGKASFYGILLWMSCMFLAFQGCGGGSTCNNSSECGQGEVCKRQKCTKGCKNNTDCASGEVCSGENTCITQHTNNDGGTQPEKSQPQEQSPPQEKGQPQEQHTPEPSGPDASTPESGTESISPEQSSPEQSTPEQSVPEQVAEKPCQKTTCQQQGKNCGRIPDGCGGFLECGKCNQGETCGGGGKGNVCGKGNCIPKTCGQLNAECGSIANGCGKLLQCGKCSSGKVCGQGSQANRCICKPTTCKEQGADCGDIPDGCGKTLQCGKCASGLFCGADGKKNKCGKKPCQPKTCQDLKAACGKVSDGCNKTLDCGVCKTGQQCDTKSNQCVCLPKTCKELGRTCGKVDNGCGKIIDCGVCPKCTPNCPTGYQCNNNVCEKGNPKKLDFDVKTIAVSGKVTLNGLKPKITSSSCTSTRTYVAMYVRFYELTHGYTFTWSYTCRDLHTKGFVFSGKIFPGTYRVSVSGRNSYVELPNTYQHVITSQAFTTPQSNLTLDVKVLDVSGKVTLNGQKPKITSSSCTNTRTYVAMYVRFYELNHGYTFTWSYTCRDLHTKGFVFSGKIFPGTYRVSVSGRNSYVELPNTYQHVIFKQDFKTAQSNLTLDVKTLDISGKVTLNGQKPKITSSSCTNTRTYVAMYVRFYELNHGYTFTWSYTCRDLHTKGFVFSGKIFPGNYRVSVSGRNSYVEIPNTYQHVLFKQNFTSSQTNLILDVKVFDVSGKVTLNGQKPKITSSSCTNTRTYVAMYVRFYELTHGYTFTWSYTCRDLHTKGFVFSGKIFPGNYRVSVSGRNSYVELPNTYQHVIFKQDFKAPQSNLTLDVKVLDVSGTVTLNGQKPKITSSSCTSTRTYVAMYVRFYELTHGYTFTWSYTCRDLHTKGFVFSGKIFPGNYRVSVSGRNSYVELPNTYQHVIFKQDFKAPQSNITLNVQVLDVSGTITLNGQKPKITSSSCTSTRTYVAMYVRFYELTHGYTFTWSYTCRDLHTKGFVFSGKVFPGVYRVSVSGRNSYIDIPNTYQHVVNKLRVP